MGFPRLRGSPQRPLGRRRSTTQRWLSRAPGGVAAFDLGSGRSEVKKRREPSGETVGLQSLKRPEKGAILGALQRSPSLGKSRRETTITRSGGVLVVGERTVKKAVPPSGVKVMPSSSSGVEITP